MQSSTPPTHCLVVLVAAVLAAGGALADGRDPVDEIVVTGGLRDDAPLAVQPSSITVIDAAALAASSAQHFEDLIPLVPNLYGSGEGSRARYLQVRGVGELEQYEGAPNAAVGFLIDDIDFSGLGGAATSFDLERVEVLRGPQGTRYGASALGGLVYVRSVAPPDALELRAVVEAGGDDLWSAGLAAGGPVGGSGGALRWRVAAHGLASNGFRDNATLGRDDTNGHDERTLRGRLAWTPAPGWAVDLIGLHVDLDNGYDAWSLDGGRATYSDQPGRDTQVSDAAALKLRGPLAGGWQFTSITTAAETDVRFGFDADWGSAAFWAPYTYRYTGDSARERRTLTQELRVATPDDAERISTVFGVYLQRFDEDTRVRNEGQFSTEDPPVDPPVDYRNSSDFVAETAAVFAETAWPVTAATTLTAGARLERRSARYREPAPEFPPQSPVDRLWGGQLALHHALGAHDDVYLRLARGFRASGFNPTLAGIDPDDVRISYGDESLASVEGGWRTRPEDRNWRAGLHFFWQQRDDMQVKVPRQFSPDDPNTFVFITGNAERAVSYGVEAEWSWLLPGDWQVYAAAGWLSTDIERFSAEPVFEGHPFPHAPRVTYALAVSREPAVGWFGRLDLNGRGSWWYDYDTSTGADRKESAVALVGLRAGYRWERLQVELWGRNLLDEDYGTRGFWFGNEPPDFPNTRYVRAGDPRQLGVRLSWQFAAR